MVSDKQEVNFGHNENNTVLNLGNSYQPVTTMDHGNLSAAVLHPYYPLGVAIPDYVANGMKTFTILAYFIVGCSAILSTALILIRRHRPDISSKDLATALWWVLCGSIHIGMEGYVVYHSSSISSSSTVLGQAWKEYSYSDSRYLTQDIFVIPMEAITAVFWGPLSFAIAYFTVVDHPLRHFFQSIVSLGQLYGDVLYYATCAYAHIVHSTVYCRPESAYFWGYFMLLNAFWIFIPTALLVSSAKKIKAAFGRVQELEREKKET